MTILLIAALLPPLVLLVHIYRMDKVEREPVGMIIMLLIFGALSTIPAGFIEQVGDGILQRVVPPYGAGNGILYQFLLYFLVVAWTEEGVKHMALKLGSWRKPAFNYLFDGVIYSVAAALGFAALENVTYVYMFGMETALLRAVTAIPGHCIFGIYMGYYYGLAKYWSLQGNRSKERQYQFLSIFMPVLLHGFYDFCATLEYAPMTIVFLVYIVILDIFAIRSIRKYAAGDTHLPGTDPHYEEHRQQEVQAQARQFQQQQEQLREQLLRQQEEMLRQRDQQYRDMYGGQGRGNDPDDPAGIGPLS